MACGGEKSDSDKTTGKKQSNGKTNESTQTAVRKDISTPPSRGKEFEVLAVGEKLSNYTELKESLAEYLADPYPGLPQREARYELSAVDASAFGNLLKRHKSVILFIEDGKSEILNQLADMLGEDYLAQKLNSNKKAIIFRDVFADPQDIIVIKGQRENWPEILGNNSNQLINWLENSESEYLKEKLYTGSEPRDLTKELRKTLGFGFRVPVGYKKVKLKTTVESEVLQKLGLKNVAWYKLDTKNSSNHLMAYSFKLAKEEPLNNDYLSKLRDAVTAEYFEAPQEGDYMEIEYRMPFDTARLEIEGRKAKLIRGLWRIEGDFMGGPFVLYAIKDARNDRLIMVDGTVYAAGSKKKPFIKRLETALKTVEIK